MCSWMIAGKRSQARWPLPELIGSSTNSTLGCQKVSCCLHSFIFSLFYIKPIPCQCPAVNTTFSCFTVKLANTPEQITVFAKSNNWCMKENINNHIRITFWLNEKKEVGNEAFIATGHLRRVWCNLFLNKILKSHHHSAIWKAVGSPLAYCAWHKCMELHYSKFMPQKAFQPSA